MKVLHILYQSTPNTSGSSIRSRDIINNQKKIGLNPIVISSPFQAPIRAGKKIEKIDNVFYYRTYSNSDDKIKEGLTNFLTQIRKFFSIIIFTKQIYQIAKAEKIELIHAHAMFYCAIPSKLVSLFLNIPMIYEVRSFWEERYKYNNFFIHLFYTLVTVIETISMYLSDEIITLNKTMKKRINSRLLLREKKITVVSNGVDIARIKIIKSERKTIVFSYIGTISPIEGLDYLVKVFNDLYSLGYENKLLIYGDGIYFNELKSLAKNNPLIEFKGVFKQNEISKIYSNVDVVVNPRKNSFLTNSVSPLKPLEAIGYKKLVLVSSVYGLTELIKNGVNGIVFQADSVIDLKRKILQIINKNDFDDIKERAFNDLQKNMNWLENVKIYKTLYKKMLNDKKS